MELRFPSFLAVVSLLKLVGGQEAYQQTALDLHNEYRARHSAPPLVLDETLNSIALRCAQYYSERGRIDHTCPFRNSTGENLSSGTGGSWTDTQFAELSTNMWYDEESLYDYSNPGFSGATGHFTQVVWVSSQRLGFALARINRTIVGVGLYSPPGNYLGQFRENVLPP